MEREKVEMVEKLSLNRRREEHLRERVLVIFLCFTCETPLGLHAKWKAPTLKEKLKQ